MIKYLDLRRCKYSLERKTTLKDILEFYGKYNQWAYATMAKTSPNDFSPLNKYWFNWPNQYIY